MNNFFQKASFIFTISILMHIIYHIALLIPGNSTATLFLCKFGRIGWISSEFILFLTGFYCSKIFFFSDTETRMKNWVSYLYKVLRWLIPVYYIFIIIYLSLGIKIQQYFGNSFNLNEGYLLSLFLFYINFKLSKGPLSGVALEGAFLLSMSLQLFFIFGFFFTLIKKITTHKIIIPAIILLSWITTIILRIEWNGKNDWYIYFNTLTRLDAFLAGLLLSWLYSIESLKKYFIERQNILLIFGIILISITAAFTNLFHRHHHLIDVLSYPALALFSIVFVNKIFNIKLPSFLENIVKYNKITFLIYLTKLPIIYIVKGLFLKLNIVPNFINDIIFVLINLLIFTLIYVAYYYLKAFRLVKYNR